MRYIKVPADIQIMVNGEPWKDSDGSVMLPWSFARYLENIVLADPAIGTAYKDLKACAIVDALFKDASPDEWVGVEDTHWEMLKNTIENPKGGGISSGILRQFLPSMDAVLEAKSEKPTDSDLVSEATK